MVSIQCHESMINKCESSSIDKRSTINRTAFPSVILRIVSVKQCVLWATSHISWTQNCVLWATNHLLMNKKLCSLFCEQPSFMNTKFVFCELYSIYTNDLPINTKLCSVSYQPSSHEDKQICCMGIFLIILYMPHFRLSTNTRGIYFRKFNAQYWIGVLWPMIITIELRNIYQLYINISFIWQVLILLCTILAPFFFTVLPCTD